MFNAFQKFVRVFGFVCLGVIMCSIKVYSASPTLKIVVNPSKTTVYAGTEPLVLTAQTSGADLIYHWTLQGPGSLDNTDLPAVFYVVPETLEEEPAQAVITVTVTDNTGQEVTESITFDILPAEKQSVVSEVSSGSKRGLSSTTKIALGAGAAATLGGGIALVGLGESSNSNTDYRLVTTSANKPEECECYGPPAVAISNTEAINRFYPNSPGEGGITDGIRVVLREATDLTFAFEGYFDPNTHFLVRETTCIDPECGEWYGVGEYITTEAWTPQ